MPYNGNKMGFSVSSKIEKIDYNMRLVNIKAEMG